ncbi:MAG TPA: SdpI family protein [Ktedonobacteraceae bacterium]|nr:SdpI family protein [Ktedonobacteraceae bacterium]
MEPSEHSGDKVSPKSWPFNATTMLAILIIVAQVCISVGTYPFLPPMVPSHFDAAGNINGYMPKLVNALLYPGMSTALYLLLRFLMQAGPNLNYRSQRRANKAVVNLIAVGILLFLLLIQLLTTAYALGVKIDISLVVELALSVLLIFLGNYMGKLRRNFWAGIRTPWTIASDVVWERTHRLGGWLFVLVGLLGIISAFIPPLRVWGLFVPIIAVVVILYVYSYIIYQRYTVEGKEPLSPPFDGGHGTNEGE